MQRCGFANDIRIQMDYFISNTSTLCVITLLHIGSILEILEINDIAYRFLTTSSLRYSVV